MNYTPLRYPGGKNKLFAFFSRMVESNFKTKPSYAEPYAGGAGLALSLLLTGKAHEIYINDKDRAIYAFWYSVLNNTNELIKKIVDTDISITEWERQKKIQNDKDNADLFKLGFSTFFLNRTNRSGIIKGGVIGGKDQSGMWKLDARFNKSDLIKRIQNIVEYKSSIHLYNKDAIAFLSDMENDRHNNILYYLDPPYINKAHGLYDNFYSKHDHRYVADTVKTLKSKWIVSYDADDMVKELYSGFTQITYDLSYSAHIIRKGREFMAFSPSIILPKLFFENIGTHTDYCNMSNITFNVA